MIGKLFRILMRWIILPFLISSVGAVLLYRWVPVFITPTMVIKSITDGTHTWKHEWVPISEMSRWMPQAVVASEDQRFLSHHGFDFKEIKKAYKEAEAGGRQRGASTITQQTAKNVFLWQWHSWVRKGLEAYFTVLIELFWSKERIMEVYLNSIEMGPGIYGVQAAAEYSFATSASRLSKEQCALISATLPNPVKYSSKHPGPYMRRRCKAILRQMRNIGPVNFD